MLKLQVSNVKPPKCQFILRQRKTPPLDGGDGFACCSIPLWENAGSVLKRSRRNSPRSFAYLLAIVWGLIPALLSAQESGDGIVVNADNLEYGTVNKEVTALGNVEVMYKGTRLTCRKLKVNTQSKDAVAEGNVRVEEKQGIVEGESMQYNFDTKVGIIINADFRSNPYFGRAREVEKVSSKEFISRRGYFTTCGYDFPHYRLKAAKVDFFLKDKVKTKDVLLFAGKVPVLYIPQYTHNLKDPLMHVQLMPGKSKEWGPYMLSAWRYNLTDYINGRIYFDYRQKLGVGEGFGANYDSRLFGRGDFKFYYTQERSRHFEEGQPAEFQRYIVRLRHKWDIDERTDLISQYYKIVDSKMMVAGSNYNILKDYFPREYEKDLQPPFYIEVHHGFNYSTMDLLIQKRPNRWYDPGYLEKLPELKYNLSSIQLGETPLYFEDVCLGGNYNKKNTSTLTPTTNASNPDAHFNRFDTYNKLSFPFKLFFLRLTPYVANRETFYSEGVSGSVSPRTIFYSGADMSTKFYRVFNFKTNAFGLDLNGLRHIITPSIGYAYNHEPTVLSSKLRQIDSIDSITRSNSAALELSNKLQTKRANRNVDIVDFRINSSYTFKPKGGSRSGSYLADIVFNLDIIPYAWLRIEADATYKHSGSREEANYNTFSNANYDVNFNLAAERSFGLGQRYQRKGPNDLTYELKWRVNPKWKFSLYHRRQIGHDYTLKRGLREQEYSIARDLHCWIVELNYNVKREKGETVWVVFRLKAFPEMEFGFNRDYHNPKPGSQSADELGG